MNDKVRPVLLVLAAPDELRVQVGIARIAQGLGLLLLLLQHRLVLGGGNVLALVLRVADGFNGLF